MKLSLSTLISSLLFYSLLLVYYLIIRKILKLSLDDSIALYSRGVELASWCDKKLNEVETKISILNKFNSVRTIKEGNELYNAIKRELNESKKSNNVIVERQLSVNESKGMNEINIYSNPSLDLMHRMDNLFK